MPARDIGWTTIAANSNVAWFVHGWGATDAVTYSIVVFPGTGNVPFPEAHATLTQGNHSNGMLMTRSLNPLTVRSL
jgi:hypothetical protein